MDIKLNTDLLKELTELREEIEKIKFKYYSQEDELLSLNKQLHESSNKLSFQETENESLRRVVNRLTVENDHLLQKYDSVSKAARILEENENILKEELKSVKEENKKLLENVMESNFARDNVIEKLKDVSLETRELIDNCEKASEESKLFQIRSEELEKSLKKLQERNEYLQNENKNLRNELESQNTDILSFQNKLVTHMNGKNTMDVKDLENNKGSSILQSIYYQIKIIIDELNSSEAAMKSLNEEVKHLKCNNNILQEQNINKDNIISKQNKDFLKVKATVDDYHSEILKLDSELKDCHKRVFALTENLEIMNSENMNLVQYTNFRRCLKKFGNIENVENLLCKLEVLQEIELFFEKKLTPHINSSDNELPIADPTVTDLKENTINKIKSYLEKALITIEKLNDKMLRLRVEYENKLRTKNAEISTLREVLSNATLYNKLLEQTLEQCKDNIQLDKTIENKTDELLTTNETLLDGFDELKLLHNTSQKCSNFLFAKIKQLEIFHKLLELSVNKWIKNDKSEKINLEQKIKGLFFLISEIFEEVKLNENNEQFSAECQRLLSKCENNLITKDYLKSSVESMSQEVKRLTNKVEHEMFEKIREIELLKGEMDNIKTDNYELVNKVKNCNREIVFLSSENYDLSEKLENIVNIGNNYEILNQELESLKNKIAQYNNENIKSDCSEMLMEEIRSANKLCVQLKNEHINLKESVISFSEKMVKDFDIIEKTFEMKNVKEERLILKTLMVNCRKINDDHQILKNDFNHFKEEIQNEFVSLKSVYENIECSKSKENTKIQLKNLMDICRDIRKEHNSFKEINFKTMLDDMILLTKTNFDEKLKIINSDFNELIRNLNNSVNCRENILSCTNHVASTLQDIKSLNNSIHSLLVEQKLEYTKFFDTLLIDIQNAVLCTLTNLKSSFTSSNEEMIKEMQEMNAELKKRGASISNLNQNINELQNENCQLLDKLKENENTILETFAKIQNYEKLIEKKEIDMETITRTLQEHQNEVEKNKLILGNAITESENLKHQIEQKDEIIVSLENEIAKHRDGDTSSMGTISRTEEVSRLNDVEDSFEERYTKLRYLAIKMKKNIADLNQQLNNEKTEKTELRNKFSAIKEQAKRSQILQEECDKLIDEAELHRNEIKNLNKIILESEKSVEDLKFRCTELSKNLELSKADITLLQNEKIEMEAKLSNLTMQLENTKKEKFAEEILKKEKDKEIQLLKQKQKDTEEMKKKIQNDFEQMKLEASKQAAFNLEMKDYEKTISHLTNEIQEKEKNIQDLSENLASSSKNNISLTERIKHLEGQMELHVANNKIADEQLLNLNESIKDYKNNMESFEQRLKQTLHQLENERVKNENITVQLINSSTELNNLKESFHLKEKCFNEKIKSLKLEITNSNNNLKKKEKELKTLTDDYEAYKVRAHSVLQKLKMENNSNNNEEKLQSEINILKDMVKELRRQLDSSLTELENQKAEINLLEISKENSLKRNKELSEIIADKTKELDTIHNEYKMHKLNTDTLISCYKVDIEKLKNNEEKLNVEIEKMRQKLEIKGSLDAEKHESNELKSVLDYQSEHNLCDESQKSKIKVIEETERHRKISKRSVLTLEKLLENDMNEPEELNKRDQNETDLQQNIKSLEEQVKYLTDILNESEKNAARNEQQVTFLKEEVRRLQRMLEREPHLQNTEYLKNILLKFITLPIGDEKMRLITVLETILKLTPQEKQTVSAIAKGYRVESKQTVGWTSFLGWS